MPISRTAFRWAVTALHAYGAIFVLLSIDLLVHVWRMRLSFPRYADVAAIFFFELSRSVVTAGALWLGLWLTWRRTADAASRALAVGIGFGTLAFTQAASLGSYPGVVQANITRWLLDHEVPRALLTFLFGSPVWAGCFALAALLVFAARFPVPVTVEAVSASGQRDRAGMLAGTALAGLDVGLLFRGIVQQLVQRHMLRPAVVGTIALLFAAVHHPLREHPLAVIAALVLAALAAGIAITLLRANYLVGGEMARDRIASLRAGAVAATLLFLAAGLAGLLPSRFEFLSAALLAVAPAPALYGVARAAFAPDRCQAVGSPPKIEITSPVM